MPKKEIDEVGWDGPDLVVMYTDGTGERFANAIVESITTHELDDSVVSWPVTIQAIDVKL